MRKAVTLETGNSEKYDATQIQTVAWQEERARETERERERETHNRSPPLFTPPLFQARTLAAALNFVAPGDASHIEPLLQACALGPEAYGR